MLMKHSLWMYIHERSVKSSNKKYSNLSGIDNLIMKITIKLKDINVYNIRFHLYPGINAVQTMGGKSIY